MRVRCVGSSPLRIKAMLDAIIQSAAVTLVCCAMALSARAATLADLLPQNTSVSPSPVTAGSTITVTYTVKNQGGTNAPSSHTKVQIKNSSNVQLTSQVFSTVAISAGSSVNESRVITIPSSASAGTYYAYVIVDNNSEVVQSNTSNDFGSGAPFTVQSATTLADLLPQNTSVSPSPVTAGSTITVSYTVKNQGGTNAPSSHTKVQIKDSSNVQLTSQVFSTSAISANSSVNESRVITIPSSASAGTYYAYVIVDNNSEVVQSNTSNDFGSGVPFTVQSATTLADLVPQSTSVSPSPVTAGSTITVSYTVKNQGGTNAPSSHTKIQIKNSSNVELTSQVFSTSAISANSSVNESRVITIPSSASAGTYYAYVIVDNNSEVVQSNTSNDYGSGVPFTVQTGTTLADLVPQNASVSPSPVTAGSTITVSYTVKNQGGTNAPSSHTKIQIKNSSNVEFTSQVFSTAAISANASVNESRILTIPSSASAGTYYAYVIVDNNSEVVQSNTSNDYGSGVPFTVQTGTTLADLVPQNASVSHSPVTAGSTITVIYTVKNQGGTNAPASHTKIQIKNSSNVEVTAPVFATPAIGANSTVNESRVVTIPSSASAGTYYSYVIVDNNSEVVQSNTSNDYGSGVPFTVQTGTTLADLVPQNASVSPSPVTAGSTITVSYTVKNQGGTNAPASHTKVQIKNSSNVEVTAPVFATPAIGANSAVNESRVVTIPSSASAGTYYAYVIVDNNSEVIQSSTSNDYGNGVPFTVQGSSGTRTLTVEKAGAGSGTVTSSPAGINCGADCSEAYAQGATVSLLASAAQGSVFAGWSGACSGTDSCTVSMSDSKTVTAAFDKIQSSTRKLTVSRGGSGTGTVTSSPTGINCGTDCTEVYDQGATVSLLASAAQGSVFAGWSGGGCSGTASCTVSMSDNRTVTATFDEVPSDKRTLTVLKDGAGSGTVTSTPAGINCGSDCSESYNQSTSVSLLASAAQGSVFAGWSGPCSGTGVCTVSLSNNSSVTATFNTAPTSTRTLTVSRNGSGSGTVTSTPAGINCGSDCSESYNEGTAVSLLTTAAQGSVFAGWSAPCSGTGSCTVNLTNNSSVTATFNTAPAGNRTITVTRAGSGSGTVTSNPAGINCGSDCSESYRKGTSVSLTATPGQGSTFGGWSGGVCSGSGVCTVKMNGNVNRSVTAIFNATGSGARIEISLISAPGNQYVISDTPAMPTLKAQARVVGVSPDPTAKTSFTWTASLKVRENLDANGARFSPAWKGDVDFKDDIVQNVVTVGEGLYTLQLKDASAIRGGRLELKATATVNGSTIFGTTPADLRINGTNPQRSVIQAYIDQSTGIPQISDPGVVHDALKRMACRESGGQLQFRASANGGIGAELIAPDDGVGILQITNSPCDPFRICRQVMFDWRANIDKAISAFRGKSQDYVVSYPPVLRREPRYKAFIDRINQERIAAGRKPWTVDTATPAFYSEGSLDATAPPNQFLQDTVRGYNGFLGQDDYGHSLHEFKPSASFLTNATDEQMTDANSKWKVWEKVPGSARNQKIGDAYYLDHVIGETPQCDGH